MSFGLPDPVQEVINAVRTALPTAAPLPSAPSLSVGLPNVVLEVPHLLDGLGSGGSSDDSSSDNDSSSDSSSSGADGGPIAVARTNSDLDHSNALVLAMLRVRLLDAFSAPIPNAHYHLIIAGQEWEDTADGDGWIEKQVPKIPDQCVLEWTYPADSQPQDQSAGQNQSGSAETEEQSNKYIYSTKLYLDFPEGDDQERIKRWLHNLGHSSRPDLEGNVRAFQRCYNRPEGETGQFSDVQNIIADWHQSASPESWQDPNSWMGFV